MIKITIDGVSGVFTTESLKVAIGYLKNKLRQVESRTKKGRPLTKPGPRGKRSLPDHEPDDLVECADCEKKRMWQYMIYCWSCNTKVCRGCWNKTHSRGHSASYVNGELR